jgi:hypothetical protein
VEKKTLGAEQQIEKKDKRKAKEFQVEKETSRAEKQVEIKRKEIRCRLRRNISWVASKKN